jgi:FkbM family methyltransferase
MADKILLSYNHSEDRIYITPTVDFDSTVDIIVRDPSTGLTIYYWKNIERLSGGCSYFLKPFIAFSFSDFSEFVAFQVEIYDSLTRQMVWKNILRIREGEIKSDFEFVISDSWHDCSYLQYWEMNHLKIYDPVNKNIEGKVVVDIGSAYGVYTKRALDLGARKVYAIEPSRSFDFIRQSFFREDRVVPIKCAISDKNGQSNLYYSDSLTTSQLDYRPDYASETVVTKRLDTILAHESEIEFIKMDIEGEEYNVINSLDSTFFDKVENWAIEFHRNDGSNVRGLIHKLVSNGYVYVIKENNSLNTGGSELNNGYILFSKNNFL